MFSRHCFSNVYWIHWKFRNFCFCDLSIEFPIFFLFSSFISQFLSPPTVYTLKWYFTRSSKRSYMKFPFFCAQRGWIFICIITGWPNVSEPSTDFHGVVTNWRKQTCKGGIHKVPPPSPPRPPRWVGSAPGPPAPVHAERAGPFELRTGAAEGLRVDDVGEPVMAIASSFLLFFVFARTCWEYFERLSASPNFFLLFFRTDVLRIRWKNLENNWYTILERSNREHVWVQV